MLTSFIQCFVPLFVAVDVIGNLPIFTALTADMNRADVRKVVRLAGLTATIVGLLFMLGGRQLLGFLQVRPPDFKIAGGLLLLMIAIVEVLKDEPEHANVVQQQVGVVPIGVPLMVGPATLVTLLLLSDAHPPLAVAGGLILNIALSLVVFLNCHWLVRVLHLNGIRAISKIVHFLLAAVAVMMIRVGVTEILH